MDTAPATAALSFLDTLGELVQRQGDAILHGRADELPELNGAIQARVRQLAAAGWRPRTPQERAAVMALQHNTQAAQTMLARRALGVQQALDALGGASEALQQNQAQRLYASAGRMGAPVLRGHGYVSA